MANGFANSAILNTYRVPIGKKDGKPRKDGKPKKGGKLGQHFDSPHLFGRPIVGLSLFSTKNLSFGL